MRPFIARDDSAIPLYTSGDYMVRHEPGVRDGVASFVTDLKVLTAHRTIDEIKLLLGQRDFVFIAALGAHLGTPCAYIDLDRIEAGKIVEHWGFPQEIPPKTEWKNGNGML